MAELNDTVKGIIDELFAGTLIASGDFVQSISLRSVSYGSYNPDTGTRTRNETSETVPAIVKDYTEKMMEAHNRGISDPSHLVTIRDRLLILKGLPGSTITTVKLEDEVVIGSERFAIFRIIEKKTMGSTVLLWRLAIRRL